MKRVSCSPSFPRRSALAALALLLGSACGGSGGSGGSSGGAANTGASTSTSGGQAAGGAGGAVPACPVCESPIALADLKSPAVAEASGVAASQALPGVLWVHNDSGDTARFFGTDASGADRGVYNVSGVTAEDWEDMAVGPCTAAGSSCLYFGDIGDNLLARTKYSIVRVVEPAVANAGQHTVSAEVFGFHYPDGPKNAEAMFVHPTTGQVFIITKDANGSQLYALPAPLAAGPDATASLLGDVTVKDLLKLVTGASMAPDASGVLMRTYSSVWYFRLGAGKTPAQALAGEPCALPIPMEMQGESITFGGDGYRTVGEGASPTLHGVQCTF